MVDSWYTRTVVRSCQEQRHVTLHLCGLGGQGLLPCQGGALGRFEGLLPARQSQNLAVTVPLSSEHGIYSAIFAQQRDAEGCAINESYLNPQP